MKHMTLKEIAVACGGIYYGEDSYYHQEVTGVAIDSRKIEPGYLFVPIRGNRVDGHMFIPQVMEAGALCTLSEHRMDGVSHPYILVNSTEQALKDIAEHYRKSLHIKVVGITGSVGKTSTKEMIASVLSQKYSVLKTEGNFNNEIGLPLTIFNIREGHEIAVLELGISQFGEMERLSRIARPDICVITNIGVCHLENLKSREGILKAKTEIFNYMQPKADIILNGDDDMLCTITKIKKSEPMFFGLAAERDAYATEIRNLGLKGTACILILPNGRIEVTIPIPGSHMVYNALAGACVGLKLGLTLDEIKAGIEALTPVSGRNHIIESGTYTLIDDCYNANPVSMRASIDVLSFALGRKVAVLGDMFELGKQELELHYEVGEYAAAKHIDLVISIGNLAREIAEGASHHASTQVLHFNTKEEFLAQKDSLLQTGDTILIKASHAMNFPAIVDALQESAPKEN
ncbi:MAG TPA: UDP-N-acetylmuramoylalanyl-D-glutamyl-2, 6-diaminopimelate--D-alanyl-D-alanine ligase [Lachnospiraceae bacterium]|nr:UDP-N-acetylmuramoylalanyl-D-glutamyl-2, 6-diaminopimelate--D-alanyl-D-alanine ligase [Lachnospiraceae bacterium]